MVSSIGGVHAPAGTSSRSCCPSGAAEGAGTSLGVADGSFSAVDAATPARAAGHEAYSAERLAELRGQNKPVFVNMTASWCISCLVNERVALSRPEVKDAFAKAGIAYLKGDWTREDPAITAFEQYLSNGGNQIPAGYIRDVVERVTPSILAGRSEGLTRVDEFEARHVVETGQLLMQRSRIIADRISTGRLAIVGLTYQLSEGQVNVQGVYGDIGERPAPTAVAAESA